MALAKVVPHFTGLVGAGVTSGAAAAGGSDGLEIAIIGGLFILLNSVLTIFLNRMLEKHDHHTRKTKKKITHTNRDTDS